MKIKLLSPVIILGAFITMFVACEKEYYVPKPIPPVDTNVVISFKDTIYPLIEGMGCGGACHKGSSPVAGVNWSTSDDAYNSIVSKSLVDTNDATSSKLYTYIESGHQGAALSAEGMNLLKLWIEKGALNN